MRVYVAGPMSGIEDHNFPAFNEAAQFLEELGFSVFNPASRGVIPGWTWERYLRDDLKYLLDCDAIYLLEGWHESRGATLENHVAKELGMITFTHTWTSLQLRIVRMNWRIREVERHGTFLQQFLPGHDTGEAA